MVEIIAWILLIVMIADPIIIILIGLKKKEYVRISSALSRGFSLTLSFGLVFSIIFSKQIHNDLYNKELYKLVFAREELNKLFKKYRVIRYEKEHIY